VLDRRILRHCFLSAFVQSVEEPTEISLRKGVQSVEVKLPCFLYICRGDGTVSAAAIAAIMAELALRSTRSGFSGHSVIHLIWSYNVIVVSSIARVLWARTIRTMPENLEVVEISEE